MQFAHLATRGENEPSRQVRARCGSVGSPDDVLQLSGPLTTRSMCHNLTKLLWLSAPLSSLCHSLVTSRKTLLVTSA